MMLPVPLPLLTVFVPQVLGAGVVAPCAAGTPSSAVAERISPPSSDEDRTWSMGLRMMPAPPFLTARQMGRRCATVADRGAPSGCSMLRCSVTGAGRGGGRRGRACRSRRADVGPVVAVAGVGAGAGLVHRARAVVHIAVDDVAVAVARVHGVRVARARGCRR